MYSIRISLLSIILYCFYKLGLSDASDISSERQARGNLFKGFSGYRLFNNSLRMVYYHDLTIAVVEIGDSMTLLNCELIEVFSDEQRKHTLEDLTKVVVRPLQLLFDDMMLLMSQCDSLDSRLINRMILALTPKPEISTNSTSTTQSSVFSGIFPGTKWCGTGDIARSYYDLGSEWAMDKCCRKHDLCPVKVKGYGSRYNLANKSLYTKSHCACDDEFAKCLKQIDKPSADFMGNIYFNILQVSCIQDEKQGRQFRDAKKY